MNQSPTARRGPTSNAEQRTLKAEVEFQRRSELVMDEDDAARQAVRQARLDKLEFFLFRALRLLAQYKGNRDMAIDCLVLAHGKGDMIGLYTATDVAIKHFANPDQKETVGKCIKMFQGALGLPAMPGQRGDAGRRAMSRARKGQLKK